MPLQRPPRIRAGPIWINTVMEGTGVCFGGFKPERLGAGKIGRFSIDEFTELKTISSF